MKENNLTGKSKYLSLILRHKPENAKLTLDKQGWANVVDLIDVNKGGFKLQELIQIVEADEKSRYQFNDDKSKIRAVQGHSKGVAVVEMEKAVPTGPLYHGTKEDVMLKIAKEGLKSMNREYVHLSDNIKTAKEVADRRKGKSIILIIDGLAMRAAGEKMYKSANGVWMTNDIPAKYIKLME